MPPLCSDCAGAIRTRFDISLPDSRRSPMAGRVTSRPSRKRALGQFWDSQIVTLRAGATGSIPVPPTI
jgi:hypothetical protein